VVKEYKQWATATGHILICGHTHQAHFPRQGEPPYWNTGCWVEKNAITGIVIENGELSLMAWDKGLGAPKPLEKISLRQ
jgi:UDP-2,3-diacylglucosamine pyrophosphatase LpxH